MSATAEQTKPDVLMRELWHVAGTGDVARLEQILAQGVDLNASDRTGVTALMRAAYHGELPMIRALIEHGADLDAKDTGGLTALMMAKHSGHAEIVDALLSSGATENAKRRVHKVLPVEAELAEHAPLESGAGEPAGAITGRSPAIRTLHEPPEIWEMVHTTDPASPPQTTSARDFSLAGKLPSARTLILAASVLMVAAGAVFGFLALREPGSATSATAQRELNASEQRKDSKPPASSMTQALTQSNQNATSSEQAKAAARSNQAPSLKSASEVEGARAQPLTPLSSQVAMPVKKSPERTADKSRADDKARVVSSSRSETLAKTPARTRGSNNDKSASSASVKSEAVKPPTPQVTAPPKTNAPKPKVIQWP